MQMVDHIVDISKRIKSMDMGYMCMEMDINMRGCGLRVRDMVRGIL